MKRAIIVPAAPAPEALAELKQWLAITTSREDAALTGLIGAALEVCESFTGLLPLECTCEELLPASGNWQALGTRPVQAIVSLEAVSPQGDRALLPIAAYELDLDADQGARVRLLGGEGQRVAVRFVAGMAASWAHLPDGLRHGVIRCAAHLYRERDGGGASVPAAITALWRPWRRMRLT